MNRRRNRWLRLLTALAAVGASTVGPLAHADSGTDQITGTGPTASAVTVSWSQGLLGNDNSTVVAQRNPNSPLSFLYPDFQNLKVTVSQTQGLVHQAINVTWSGLLANGTNGGFLQIMQCYGDKPSGPDPEGCEFGTPANLFPSGLVNASAGSRTGAICVKNGIPNTTNPPGSVDGSGPAAGCDAGEPADPTHLDPGSDNADSYSVPFVPAGTTDKVYQGQLRTDFDQFDTNEVQQATSSADGTGQDFFQALTGTEAPGLGCGQAEASGKARGCWLVLVPRGQYDANGFRIHGNSALVGNPTGSPLGASLWAQRIQIHLGFAPISSACPVGSVQERQTVGTELVAHAVFSWQLALNAAANCHTLYGYSSVPESTSTRQLSDTTGASAGLAFTNIPIGSEITRTGGTPGAGPPLVYAPVAVSAITFAFNINLPSTNGFYSTPIKLTPLLLAKVLTQSYRYDLPDFYPAGGAAGPAWAKNNPLTITQDPDFLALNPNVSDGGVATSLAPLITEDHSAVNQQVWQWIVADPAARTWLGGQPDAHGMVVNPNYQQLNLGSPPGIDSYPRADPTCFNTGGAGEKDPGRCALNLLPYVNNLEDGAARVRAANNPLGPGWDPTLLAPDGSTGWWSSGTLEGPRTTFLWTVTDSPDLADYGLVPAQLCDGGGNNCVGPNSASISAALGGAQADGTGLLHVSPAAPGSGGYPLVDVTYAAVRTTQSAQALNDFATLIDYAAGPGQTPGVDPGQLPHGYLPMPPSLQQQATAAADVLRADANPPPPSGPTGGGGSTTAQPNSVPAASQSTPTASGSSPVSTAAGPAAPGATPDKPGAPTKPNPKVALTAHTTPSGDPGAVRWLLLVVVIAGGVGVLSGWLLRRFGS